MQDPECAVVEVVGVYDADGGVRGELAYLFRVLTGRGHCTLCDVTHSPVRRKKAWDALVRDLPVPLRAAHRNELGAAEQDAALRAGLPVVLGRCGDGSWRPLLDRDELARLDGSVEVFGASLRSALGL